MGQLAPLIAAIQVLCTTSDRSHEELLRLTIEGQALTDAHAMQIRKVNAALDTLGVAHVSLLINGNQIDDEMLENPQQFVSKPWRCVISKRPLVSKIRMAGDAQTFLFLDQSRFITWLDTVDPLLAPANADQPFAGQTILRVNGMAKGLWGPSLKILGVDEVVPIVGESTLPEETSVQTNVSISASTNIKLRPRAWEITCGDEQSSVAVAIRRKSARVIAACLVQQITETTEGLSVMLKGTRKVIVPLVAATDDDHKGLASLNEALSWVYSERAETRIKLLVEALCAELDGASSLLKSLKEFLPSALKQARDSYGFVILERKDAYHKEMREFMKDMKAQADLYATKVRDLVSALTRDILGLLVLVGFSFIAKFDPTKLQELNSSQAFKLLCHILAGYLVLSAGFLMYTSYRDANLGFDEIKNWFKILQSYTSSNDFSDRVLGPLKNRRLYLWRMMVLIGVMYVVLVLVVWTLPISIRLLMGWPG
ncbi:MAG: hypothetical protein JWQ10_4005 [Herbaspirillum sp.]|nr:hypothetical protein [Herbaspirillum sp.]